MSVTDLGMTMAKDGAVAGVALAEVGATPDAVAGTAFAAMLQGMTGNAARTAAGEPGGGACDDAAAGLSDASHPDRGPAELIRVVVAEARGSTPREAGAEMVVSLGSVAGSIGGGALEYMAIDRARQMLARGEAWAEMNVPLGPEIGQCCGGRVRLSLDRAPLRAREPGPEVLIFGAGHVGRALAVALAPLPVRARLIDSRAEELARATGETTLTPLPEAEIRAAAPDSAFVILTHDHALDFLLAAEALARGDATYVGMIGSRTKRATFLRHSGADPARLTCPIAADAPRDKRPEVIAAFAAAEILAALLTRTKVPA